MTAPDRPWSDADRELIANAYHWADSRRCEEGNCPGALECCYAEHLFIGGFRAVLDALTADGWDRADRVREQVAEEAAKTKADAVGALDELADAAGRFGTGLDPDDVEDLVATIRTALAVGREA